MRFLPRFLLVLGCVALVLAGMVAAFYAVEDWRGARAWAAVQREVRARGGTTNFTDVIPPPVPDDQNLAMAPLFANALDYHVDPVTRELTFGTADKDKRLDGLPYGIPSGKRTRPTSGGGWERGHTMDLAAWQEYFRADPKFPRLPDPQSPAADVRLALSRYGAPLDELAEAAATRPRSRFPINWHASSPFMISLRHGTILQELGAALRLRACAELADGDHARAAADLALIFRLSDALVSDAILIDHLVNITILGLAAQPIWDGLESRRWDAGELARLQEALGHQDVLANYKRAIRCEEASVGRGLDYLERHGDGKDLYRLVFMPEPEGMSLMNRLFYGFVGIAPHGWYDQNKACLVHYEQTYVLEAVDPATHRAFPEKLAAGAAARQTIGVGPYTLFFHEAAPVFDTMLARSARTQAICDQEAIACALERFYLEHQTYPDHLDALVPGFLDRVPTDVIDGAPMRYRRTPDGRYLLYSIGWNGRDDGGQVAWKEGPRLDDRAGDWVWQYQPLQPPANIPRGK